MCKPHKTCGECRWTPQEKQELLRLEKIKKQFTGKVDKNDDE